MAIRVAEVVEVRRAGDEMPPEDYSYNCIDRSILLPLYVKYYVAAFYRHVPGWLTANFITLIASSMMWLTLAICLVAPSTADPTIVGGLFALLLHNYLLGDHLDGMRAKRTGTSSSLGEFLDHYLDVYNGAIIVLACFFVLGMPWPTVFGVTLWLYFAAFGATMVEGKEHGKLHFGAIGCLEADLIIVAFFATWAIPSIRELWLGPAAFGLPRYSALVGVTVVGFAWTALDVILRLGRLPWQFAVFLLGSLAIVVCAGSLGLGQLGTFFLMTLYAGDYIGRVMGSSFMRKSHPCPDLSATAVLTLLSLAQLWWQPGRTVALMTSVALFAHLVLRLGQGVFSVLNPLRRHWRWTIPDSEP